MKPLPHPPSFAPACRPLLEVWRGPIVESVHSGAIAVVRPDGRLTHSCGDPRLVTFVRSAAKPFQLLPFVELGGPEQFGLSEQELAILCASHDGTDAHVRVLEAVQAKVGISEADLQCGAHPPYHGPSQKALWLRGEEASPNRHNCSGKHTGMLALAKMLDAPKEDYLERDHPVQQAILRAFSEMTSCPVEEIAIGIDGCSAPVFGVSLYHAALGFARLADPGGLPEPRCTACRRIVRAMTAHPEMIAGPGTFDTVLMQATGGRVFTKAGAEGFQGTGVLPGTCGAGSPAMGIALKVADGDISGKFREAAETEEGRVRPIATIEALRQLEALSTGNEALDSFDARPHYNWRGLEVGSFQPVFTLEETMG